MKIFHGSNIKIEVPQIIVGKYTKDFGFGFYCTKMKNQAGRLAKKFETPIVDVYEYDENNNLKVLIFEEMTDEWLDFIVSCRAGILHNYDVVIGPMADDQVYNYVSDFISGVITREAFWALAKFKKPTHQIAFCTQESLSFIKFVESYEVKSEK